MKWYNDITKLFMSRGYLDKNQTIEDKISIISKHSSNILGKGKDFENKLKEYIKKGWYIIPTPVWKNFHPNTLETPISCFGVYVEDSVESIVLKSAEVALQNKIGGGSSGTFQEVRGRGEKIGNEGVSNGSVSMMEIYQTMSSVISQPNRRGHFSATQDIEHKDAHEFLDSRSEGHVIQDLSVGVKISDEFINGLLEEKKENVELFRKLVKQKYDTGFPYIFFTDNVNNNTVDVYKDKGYKIHHSNMCVTGDQLVVTSNGLRTVLDLYKSQENLVLFDGEKAVNASPMRLIEKDVNVYEIITKSGKTHRVTDYHKIKTVKGMVECKDLNVGDKVYTQRNKGLFGSYHNPSKALLLGLYQGDGTQGGGYIHFDIWENDFDLEEEIVVAYNNVTGNKKDFIDCAPSVNGVKKKRLSVRDLKDFSKGEIPSWILESDEETQWAYIRGLFLTDGTASLTSGINNQPLDLSLTSTNKEFLQKLQIVFSNLGINSKVYNRSKEGMYLLPNGKGGKKEYKCKSAYKLSIQNKNHAITFNDNTKFLDRKGVKLKDFYRDNSSKFDTIVDITHLGKEDVYCTTVDTEEHVWVCNSFITSNCQEIMLPNSPKETFICNLLGMNVELYDEWKDTDAVEVGVFFMDSMLTDFIDKTKSKKEGNEDYYNVLYKPSVTFAERHRAMGMGMSGLHSFLQSKMIPFNSLQGKTYSKVIAKQIHDQAYKASEKMAKEYGKPDMLKEDKYKRRHTTLLAIAPNSSSSFVMGQQSQSIEPYVSNYYIRDVAKVRTSIKNPYLEKLLKELGKNNSDVWLSILKNNGSVQHLDFLTEEQKDVFKTFIEIPQVDIISMASDRQKYIDQGQSLNLMVGSDTTPDEVAYWILYAWKKGIKTLYYQLNVSAAQDFTNQKSKTECSSCSG